MIKNSFTKIYFIFLITIIVTGCSSSPHPNGYVSSGFPFYKYRPKYPCATEKFSSYGVRYFINNHLDHDAYPNVQVKSIIGLVSDGNKNATVDIGTNTLTCNATLVFTDGSQDEAQLTYNLNEEMYSTSMRSRKLDDYKEKKQKQEIEKADAEYSSKFPMEEYPYIAFVSCNLSEGHMPLISCFTNQVGNTNFEIKNGDDYKLYTMYDLFSLGRQGNPGVAMVLLRNNFSISARNASQYGILNILIKDRKTDKILFEKSAGLYDSILVGN